jgi:hypothetical protein
VLTDERIAEAEAVVSAVRAWATRHDDVRGVLVVGSWARGSARMDSDVDVVVLTDAPRHAEPDVWLGLLGGRVVRRQQWGPLREIRLERPSGLEVEIGVAPVHWAATAPVDAGTYRVVHDGHRIVHDPDGILAALSEACR